MINQAIQSLVENKPLSLELARQVFEEIMSGEATPAQIGGYLVAQRLRGDTLEVIQAGAEVMRAKATPIPCKSQNLVDTCGTGGDHSGTFNISTTAAFVAAGAGVKIAKHGNRSVSSKSGSADVLLSLGLNLNLSAEQVAACVDEIGIGFLFAPALHGAMKHAIGPRRELEMRSIFNLLGPLTNPAGAKRQVMGVFAPELTTKLSRVLGELGSEHIWVVHGLDGLDELSLTACSMVSELKNGEYRDFEFDPRHYGFELCQNSELAGQGPEENATITRSILEGARGPKRDIVVLNAAAAILVSGLVETYEKALVLAQESIDSKAALSKLTQLCEKSQSYV
jgi:anthranilate phosphoribosyltransferase